VTLAGHSRVQLIWVLGHKGITGNKTANLLAKQGAGTPFTGSEPAYDISDGAIRESLRNWGSRQYLDTGSPLLDQGK